MHRVGKKRGTGRRGAAPSLPFRTGLRVYTPDTPSVGYLGPGRRRGHAALPTKQQLFLVSFWFMHQLVKNGDVGALWELLPSSSYPQPGHWHPNRAWANWFARHDFRRDAAAH